MDEVNSYTNFASLYDRLMHKDFEYEQWADYLENLFSHYGKNPQLVADLACGTGNMTIPLSRRGYEMIGLDASEDMLNIAREKAQAEGLDILFLRQNMTRMDLYGTVDAFLCMIDGMNYVLNPESLQRMFRLMKTCFLDPDGIFIFDISTEHKLAETIGNQTFNYSDETLFYSWENRYLTKKRISDMYLTFFVKQKKGGYRRFSERHLQRAYRPEELVTMLKKAGFSEVDCYDELSFDAPKPDADRIVFVAR